MSLYTSKVYNVCSPLLNLDVEYAAEIVSSEEVQIGPAILLRRPVFDIVLGSRERLTRTFSVQRIGSRNNPVSTV